MLIVNNNEEKCIMFNSCQVLVRFTSELKVLNVVFSVINGLLIMKQFRHLSFFLISIE